MAEERTNTLNNYARKELRNVNSVISSGASLQQQTLSVWGLIMEILHNHNLQEEYFLIQQFPKQILFHVCHHGTKS